MHEPHGRCLQIATGFFKTGCEIRECPALCRRTFLIDDLEERLNCPATILRQLPANKVHRLYAVGAFVNHRDTGIAHILLHAPFGDVAMATIDLLRIGGDFIALVCAIALNDGRQQRQKVVRHLPFFLSLRMVQQIGLQSAPQAQGTHAFCKRLGIHQHAAHIGVHEQGVGFLLQILQTGQRAALTAILRIMHGILVSDFGNAKALLANTQTRDVHHDEHGGEALIFFTDKITCRAVIIHDAGRIAVNAHLMFDRTTGQCVPRAKRAVIIHQKLGHDEQRNAFDAVRCAGCLGQDEVNDILGQVMVARRDENLRSGNGIAAIIIGHSLGADKAKVGSAMRLGQVHCPAPFARNHIRRIFGFLFVAALH